MEGVDLVFAFGVTLCGLFIVAVLAYAWLRG